MITLKSKKCRILAKKFVNYLCESVDTEGKNHLVKKAENTIYSYLYENSDINTIENALNKFNILLDLNKKIIKEEAKNINSPLLEAAMKEIQQISSCDCIQKKDIDLTEAIGKSYIIYKTLVTLGKTKLPNELRETIRAIIQPK